MNRVLGLDVGEKWIGVAISDETFTIATPLETIERTSNKEAYTLGPTCQMVQKFSEKLKNKFRLELVYVDERMTTLMAKDVLMEASVRRENRKKYVDKIAAAFILKTYMDSSDGGNDGKNSIL